VRFWVESKLLTVACVLSPGPTYNLSHVERLEKMVAQHMRQPYRFVCVDDSQFPRWFAKIDLWRPGRFTGRVLYLDLDVTVVGNLDDLANHLAHFVIIKNFKEVKESPKAKFNSSVMAWNASPETDHLFSEFTPDDMKLGDQDYISERMPDVATFPEDWCVSYKVQKIAKLKTLPRDARVVCYHGKPKPFELPDNELDGFSIV
jgi:hypothetical protein